MKNMKAFTLAEMLIALSLVGILALLLISGVKQEKNQQQLNSTLYDKVYDDVYTATKSAVSFDLKNTKMLTDDAADLRDRITKNLDVASKWDTGDGNWKSCDSGLVADLKVNCDEIKGATLTNGVNVGFISANSKGGAGNLANSLESLSSSGGLSGHGGGGGGSVSSNGLVGAALIDVNGQGSPGKTGNDQYAIPIYNTGIKDVETTQVAAKSESTPDIYHVTEDDCTDLNTQVPNRSCTYSKDVCICNCNSGYESDGMGKCQIICNETETHNAERDASGNCIRTCKNQSEEESCKDAVNCTWDDNTCKPTYCEGAKVKNASDSECACPENLEALCLSTGGHAITIDGACTCDCGENGYFNNASYSCVTCESYQKLSEDKASCVCNAESIPDCGNGTFNTSTCECDCEYSNGKKNGDAKCYHCPAGQYLENETCHDCEISYYCPGNDTREECGKGATTNKTGAISKTECTSCMDNFYGVGPDDCKECPDNSFSVSGENNDTCKCNKDYYGDGKSSCTRCPDNSTTGDNTEVSDISGCICTEKGYYLNGNKCEICPKNYYCPGENKISSCPENTPITDGAGKSSETECITCVAKNSATPYWNKDTKECLSCQTFGDNYHWVNGSCIPCYGVYNSNGECVCPEGTTFNNETQTCDIIDLSDSSTCSTNDIPIFTAQQLASIGKDEKYPLAGSYCLMNNIDLKEAGYDKNYDGGKGWKPIGKPSLAPVDVGGLSSGKDTFMGSFNGDNHEIKNLYINRGDEDYIGLFGYTSGCQISNVKLTDVDVLGEYEVGGLVGDFFGTIANSHAIGTVTGEGDVGGLVGSSSGPISNSHATGTVTGEGDVGGLVGYSRSAIKNSHATGTVTGEYYVGGLAGHSNDAIKNSHATGTVTGEDYVGGLVGYAWGTISNSYATGTVTGENYVSGLAGYAYFATVENSYYDYETTGQPDNHGRGIPKSTFEMKNPKLYIDAKWDEKIWCFNCKEYPLLIDNMPDGASTNSCGTMCPDCGENATLNNDFECSCKAGYIGNGTACEPCEKGSYSSETDTACEPCPLGSTTTVTSGATSVEQCDVCAKGYYMNDGVCTACPTGSTTYNDVLSIINNTAYPKDEYCKGKSCKNDDEKFEAAKAFCSNLGGRIPTPADVCKILNKMGMVCNNNYYVTGQVAEGKTLTNFGPILPPQPYPNYQYFWVSENGNEKAYWGLGDHYSLNYDIYVYEKKTICVITTKEEGATSVNECLCPENSYMNDGTCTACPTGSITKDVGAKSIKDCNVCEKGYYRDNDTCTACPTGSTTSNGVLKIINNKAYTKSEYCTEDRCKNDNDDNEKFEAAKAFCSKLGGHVPSPHEVCEILGNMGMVCGGNDYYNTGKIAKGRTLTNFGPVLPPQPYPNYQYFWVSENGNKIAYWGLGDNMSLAYKIDGYEKKTICVTRTNEEGSTSINECHCSKDSYMNNGSCEACPTGSTTANVGTTSIKQCECQNGTHLQNGECIPCPEGTEWNEKQGRCLTVAREDSTCGAGMIPITTAQELAAINTDETTLADSYCLMNDIDLKEAGYDKNYDGGKGWKPIGSEGQPFSGNFNGDNHEIQNLYINRTDENDIGLFGYTSGGQISNVKLTDVDVLGEYEVGGLVGYSRSAIKNSYTQGTVTGLDAVGGLVGESYDTIENSYAECTVTGENYVIGGLVGNSVDAIKNSHATGTVTGEDYVGGLAGYSNNTIENSYAQGTVTGYDVIGGLVGESDSGAIKNSYAQGTVTGNNSIGGLVGESYSTIENSHAIGEVSGESDVGGLVGASNDKISNSYATSTVEGRSQVGGLAGESYSTIENSYAMGTVTGIGGVGGLVGWTNNTVENSYATSTVTGEECVSGLVAESDGGTISNSYYDYETTGQHDKDGRGIPKSTIEMKNPKLYKDAKWDENIWCFNCKEYPLLIDNMPDGASNSCGTMCPDCGEKATLNNDFECSCKAGYIGNGTACEPCEKGSYSSETATACEPCPLGSTTTVTSGATSVTQCDVCTKGYYMNDGVCTSCPEGSTTYNDVLSIINNTAYPKDEYCKGKSCKNDDEKFEAAKAFCSNLGGHVPSPHEVCKMLANMGMVCGSNDYYITGQVAEGKALTNFGPILPPQPYPNYQYFWVNNNDETGYWGLGDNMSLAYDIYVYEKKTICVTSTKEEGATNVNECHCNKDSYMNNGSCEPCPTSSTTNRIGATSISECHCPKGMYMDNGSCIACPNNSSTSVESGATSVEQCNVCAEGYYYNDGACTICPENYYCEGGELGVAVECVTATSKERPVTNGEGASSIDECISCNTRDGMDNETWDDEEGTCKASNCPEGSTWNEGQGRCLTAAREDSTCGAGMIPITTAQELAAINTDETTLAGSYCLMNNIDLKEAGYGESYDGGKGWKPIEGFSGEFNGDNHEIQNLYINRPDNRLVGLFDSVDSNSTIQNVHLTNVDISGSMNVGALVGHLWYATISNVSASGHIEGTASIGGLIGWAEFTTIENSNFTSGSNEDYDVIGNDATGGLVGYTDTVTIRNSYSTANIYSDSNAGGLIGYADYEDNSISNSYSMGKVGGLYTIGGLVGLFGGGSIDNSYATGEITGDGYNHGGLVGQMWAGTIENSYATGKVEGSENAGGLVGFYNDGTIKNSYATGEATGSQNVGGLVGSMSGSIENCYAEGKAVGDYYVGGLAGSVNGSLKNSYSTGKVEGELYYTGGLVGQMWVGTVENSYYDEETSNQHDNDGRGIPKSTAEMKNPSTFVDWKPSIWKLVQNNYPKLWCFE